MNVATDTDLSILEAEIGSLPKLADEWPAGPLDVPPDWQWEWAELMSRFTLLAEAHRTGQLTPEQDKRYQRIAGDLADLLPLVDQLGLPRPRISPKQ